jgi:hypothetical protein
MSGTNRVVVGLPDRYEKAKSEIARLERRIATTKQILALVPLGPTIEQALKTLDGEYD